jgi:hypothetical protein
MSSGQPHPGTVTFANFSLLDEAKGYIPALDEAKGCIPAITVPP